MLLSIATFTCFLFGASALGDLVDLFSVNDTAAGTTYFCIKIPTLIEHPATGVLIALGEGRVASCSDVAWTDLVMRRSTDGGTTWSALEVLLSNSSSEDTNVVGNAAPVVDRSNGRIWLPYNRNNQETWITFSDDAGATWAPSVFHPELQRSEWLWVGVGPPGGIQLESSSSSSFSGRLLVPGYHSTYWPAPDKSSFGSGLTKGHVLLSDDHGQTWRIGADDFGYMDSDDEDETVNGSSSSSASEGSAVAGFGSGSSPLSSRRYINECQAAELPDGTVVINSRVFSDKRAITYSSDGGESFPAAPVWAQGLFETFQGCEGSTVAVAATATAGGSSSSSSSYIVKNSSGNGTLLYSGVQGRTPARIYREDLGLFSSDDGGRTWSRVLTVWEGSSAYSALAPLTSSAGKILRSRRQQEAGGGAGSKDAKGHKMGVGGSGGESGDRGDGEDGLSILFERSNCQGSGPGGCPLIFLPEHISFQVLY